MAVLMGDAVIFNTEEDSYTSLQVVSFLRPTMNRRE